MILLTSLQSTLQQILVVLVPMLTIAIAMDYVSGAVEKYACAVFGMRLYTWGFGWLGTSVHELGHALMCPVFGHKIERISLFTLDPESTTPGQVEHSYNPHNLYHLIGNLFISIAPLFLGAVVIYISAILLLPDGIMNIFHGIEYSLENLSSFKGFINFWQDIYESFLEFFENLLDEGYLWRWQFYVFIYIVFSVGSAMKLSFADLKGAMSGFSFLFILLLATNFVLQFLEIDEISDLIETSVSYLSPIYSILIFALLINIVFLIILTPISAIFKA